MIEERMLSEQEKDVVDFIIKHGSITTLQAFGIGVARLASRVFDMKEKGIPIQGEMVTVENRKGEKCRVKRYWLSA